MIQFAYPLINLIVGLALAVYGLIHAATHVPATTQMQMFYAAVPSLLAVLIFLLGVVAVCGGLSLLASGVQGLKKRKRVIGRIYGPARDPYADDDDDRGNYYR
jgi:hypothetical protein